ncbi:MAG: saccharopine dehydrogenase NADP-binding domain-containing protein [Rhizobiaceae bacterium]
MIKRVLVIGGYGNFGSFISRHLASDKRVQVIVAGRSLEKAQKLANEIGAEFAGVDINQDFDAALQTIQPDIVVHTSGPFQGQGYDVARACIGRGCNYIDLADARDFVQGIGDLDELATKHRVLVVSGASSVPCLSAALVDHYSPQFATLEDVDYGITTAQKTARGLATTAAILGYAGKPFKTLKDGNLQDVYGWQDLHLRKYRKLGWRLLGNCDVPDLALFPKRYQNLRNLRFAAGLEIPLLHMVLWVLSWMVRLRLIKRLDRYATTMLKLSFLFDWLGSSNSAFHMRLSGKGQAGQSKSIVFELTARAGDGPFIPCMPSILLVQKLVSGELVQTGAFPCLGLVSLNEYLEALGDLDIAWEETLA